MRNTRVRRKGLLPCPHCGGRAGVYEDYTGGWAVQCDKCGATTLKTNTPEECTEKWNRRISCDTCNLYSHNDGCMAALVDEGEVTK